MALYPERVTVYHGLRVKEFEKDLFSHNSGAHTVELSMYYDWNVIMTASRQPRTGEKTRLLKTDLSIEIARKYDFNGSNREYSIHSFSKEIGKNLTLLKTPYGSIIFDCGAKCSINGTDYITEEELNTFLLKNQVKVSDIIAVLISHAHLDHYGSLPTLINIGIPAAKIFMSLINRKLIETVSTNIPLLGQYSPISAFFVAQDRIKIVPFPNGHILGSEGYVVSFDNINIVYSGDYCLHDQKTVAGLKPDSILAIEAVKLHGIDTLITETTYGQRASLICYSDMVKVFRHFVMKLIENGYKVFIPSFAIGRSQEIALMVNGDGYNVLIDGLAIAISKMYDENIDAKIFNSHTRYNITRLDQINNFESNDIIIASSGMLAVNSTSAYYLEQLLGNEQKVAVIKTGYISSESYGNELLERWCNQSNSFFDISLSAHADAAEILALINSISPKCVVTIHGAGLPGVKSSESATIKTVPIATAPAIVVKQDESDGNRDTFGNKTSRMTTLAWDKTILNLMKQLILVASHSDYNDEAFSTIYSELFKSLRLYPRYKNMLQAYRQTNSIAEIVELTRKILDGQCGQQ